MLQQIRVSIISILISSFMFADVFMTELTDPQNSSDAGRYVELYNNGDEVVDLSSGWTVQRWTNGNADPTASSVVSLTGSIVSGGFYIICNDLDKFATTYSSSAILCDEDIGTGGFADSNGDDNMALLNNGVIVDVFGVPGEDGTGTWHEFEDGRAERAAGVTSGCITPDLCEVEWNIDNDSGGGDGNQYAPEGFDPGVWIGAGEAPSDVYGCMDVFGLNFYSEATADDGSCEYATHVVEAGSNYFSPSDISINMGESVQWNNVQGYHDVVADDGSFSLTGCSGPCLIGSHTFDVAGTFSYVCSPHASMGMVGTITVVDPTVSVTFSVDMSVEGITSDGVSVRVNGGDFYAMDDSDGDLTFTYTMNLAPGDYEYNFYDGWYEGAIDGDCAGGNYGNDRFLTVENDVVLDTVCWESCEVCSVVVEGCTDSTALNFDENATMDNGTCEYAEVEEAAPLFFSEASEGSSNNKYLEIYNPTDQTVDLTNYAFANTSNAPSVAGEYEYFNTLTNVSIEPGDVFVICHGSSDESILEDCDQFYSYMSNGDDGFCLIHGTPNEDNTALNGYTILDCVGDWYGDPGTGWDVAGVSGATKDHTIVRKTEVMIGNGGDWTNSAGTNTDDSEWIVFDVDTWDYVGFHPHDFSSDVLGCMLPEACNYNPEATVDDGTCAENDCLGECGGAAVLDECGNCNGTNLGCTVYVWATVDMSLSTVGDDGMKARISTINGDYSPSEWYPMEDNQDGTWSIGLQMAAGSTYGYNFNNNMGSGYESGSGLGDCAGGSYGNDRIIEIPEDAVANSEIVVPVVCWESCEACPTEFPGCMDETAENFDPNATYDDDSCVYGWPPAADMWFSEYAEGSSNNKYLEIYNGTDSDVDLSGYSLSSCSNGCDDGVSWDYPDNVTFAAGTMVAPGDVYVVCHGSSDDVIMAECDQTFTYLSNGDDVFALTQIGSGIVLDQIGVVGADPGSGWEVAGVGNATKDHTLVRKSGASTNGGYWEPSAGTNAEDSEWVVLDQNDWTYLGSHPHEFSACDTVEDCFGDCGGSAVVDCAGVCGGTAILDCADACVDGPTAESYIGDGYCDDGSWGYSLDCPAFNCDAGDCGNTLLDDGTCGVYCASGLFDCAGVCDGDSVLDCVGTCASASTVGAWVGDGLCDDGSWGYDFQCADFNCDAGDCGTEVLDDGSCGFPAACAYNGDANEDGDVNVTDIVLIVGAIISDEADDELICSSDINGDGSVNVTDIVFLVNSIINGGMSSNTIMIKSDLNAEITIVNNELHISSNEGNVQGVQLTLNHLPNFEIELMDANGSLEIAEYNTIDKNTTIVLLVASDLNDKVLATTKGKFVITEKVVVDEFAREMNVKVTEIVDFSLKAAYPNPFNPSTTLELVLPEAGYVSLKVYNLVGQEVATLADGMMEANTAGHVFQWNASGMASGVYLVRAESAGNISSQKLMLLK